MKTGKIKLSGKLTKLNKKTPFNVYCPDLDLNKYILSDDYFIKVGITNIDKMIKIAKEKTIELLEQTLRQRQGAYEFILNNDINTVLIWKPKEESKSGIGMSQFYFMIGKKKISGTVSYIIGENESYLEFPWMNKHEKIATSDENEYKELVFKTMQEDSFEKLEILKEFN